MLLPRTEYLGYSSESITMKKSQEPQQSIFTGVRDDASIFRTAETLQSDQMDLMVHAHLHLAASTGFRSVSPTTTRYPPTKFGRGAGQRVAGQEGRGSDVVVLSQSPGKAR